MAAMVVDFRRQLLFIAQESATSRRLSPQQWQLYRTLLIMLAFSDAVSWNAARVRFFRWAR